MKHLFIVNPVAGKLGGADKYSLIKKELSKLPQKIREQLETEIYLTKAPMDAVDKIKAEAFAGEELRVYACGGDGTLNECVNGAAGFPNVAVSHFPCGTGNDFIKMFGREEQLFYNLKELLFGKSKKLDLIDCCGRKAINICSVGVDARIAADVHKYSNWPLLGGPTGYVVSGAVNVFKGISSKMKIQYDENVFDGEYTLICGCNGRYYGGGFNPVPYALPDDGYIDFLIVEKVSKLDFVKFVGKYAKGKSGNLEPVTYIRGKQIKIDAEKNMVVNIDGEIIESSHVEMKIIPKGINFIFPEECSFLKTDI